MHCFPHANVTGRYMGSVNATVIVRFAVRPNIPAPQNAGNQPNFGHWYRTVTLCILFLNVPATKRGEMDMSIAVNVCEEKEIVWNVAMAP